MSIDIRKILVKCVATYYYKLAFYLPRRNLNYFSNAYAAAVSAVDPDAGNGELCIKVPSELWKHVDGKAPGMYYYTVK